MISLEECHSDCLIDPFTVFSTFDMDQSGKIRGHHWKTTTFERDLLYHFQIWHFYKFEGALSIGVNGFSLTGPCQKLKSRGMVYTVGSFNPLNPKMKI